MNHWNTRSILGALVFVLGLVVTAPAMSHAQTAAPGATSTPVQDLARVQDAVVRIRSIGDFYDPDEGAPTNAVGGTGFLIDPSGLVVTNNHVVAGARSLQVFVPGQDRPHRARILGLSECSDLALLQIPRSGYPYLDWSTQNVVVGAPVYAAGYPAEEAAFTQGTVVQIFTESNSNLISVDQEILHTAALAPGNSGGPLVNAAGQVVGVNFGESVGEARFAAVPQSEVQSFLTQLRQDATATLGINGVAWTEGTATGVWVAAVHPGSVADAAGLQAGDILVELDGINLGTDQTVEGFCNILQAWDGQRALSFRAITDGAQRMGAFAPAPQAQPTGSFHWLRTRAFDAVLPADWTDIATETDAAAGTVTVSAATRLGPNRGFEGSSGVSVSVRKTLAAFDLQRILDSVETPAPSCRRSQRQPHQHTFAGVTYIGFYDVWTNCFDVNASFFVFVAQPETEDQLVFATFLALTQEDDRFFDIFRNTFKANPMALEPDPQVTPELPNNPLAQIPSAPPVPPPAAATVLVAALNVRSGPGTTFSRIAGVGQGVQLQVRGRAADCSWLAVTAPAGVQGWISAAADLVSLSTDCASLPVVQPSASAENTPVANETQGCIVFDNQLDVGIAAALTQQDGSGDRAFAIPPGAQQTECFDPGAYTYTLEAPPPWIPLNGNLTLRAGDRYRLPIQEE